MSPIKESDKGKDKEKPIKLIKTTNGLVRVSQACDRCRIKKIKCNGGSPCNNCHKIGFNCQTSDKLTRRAFPKGYTENLENKVKELELFNNELLQKLNNLTGSNDNTANINNSINVNLTDRLNDNLNDNLDNNLNNNLSGNIQNLEISQSTNSETSPNEKEIIDQIFNLNENGLIIGNDNLNFESQFNNLLESLGLPLLKLSNSHNNIIIEDSVEETNNELNYNHFDTDINDIYIKLVTELANINTLQTISDYFNYYNCLMPILNQEQFTTIYNEFTIDTNKYTQINKYFNLVIQLKIITVITNPETTLLASSSTTDIIKYLPYINLLQTTIPILQTYLLYLYHSLITNNKHTALKLSSVSNSLIGILGINLNHNNLFFNDGKLTSRESEIRIKLYWSFKILLKIFNLKFGFRPSINTTVINPITIQRYFELTPPALSSISSQPTSDKSIETSIQWLNLLNVIIPSSFSPSYHDGLAYYDDDGNLNHDFKQFKKIDDDLNDWRINLKKIGLFHGISIGNDVKINDSDLVMVELNFNYLIIRCINYLNFFINKELDSGFYVKLSQLSRESLAYFISIFDDQNANSSTDNNNKRRKLSDTISSTSTNTKFIINNLTLGQINFQKSLILQMIYLLICSLKIFKKNGLLIIDSQKILNQSVNLFISVFLPQFKNLQSEECEKLVNTVDIDDLDTNEDLKKLYILWFIKQKINDMDKSFLESGIQSTCISPIIQPQTINLNASDLFIKVPNFNNGRTKDFLKDDHIDHGGDIGGSGFFFDKRGSISSFSSFDSGVSRDGSIVGDGLSYGLNGMLKKEEYGFENHVNVGKSM